MEFRSGMAAELGFQLGNPGPKRGKGLLDLGSRVAGSDVFRAVPIERHDFDEKQSFDDAARFRFGEPGDHFRVPVGVGHAGMTEDFQPGALCVIHEEQHDPVVAGEISGGEHLPIAFVVGEGDLGWMDDLQETRLAAAMLDIRPVGFCHGRQVEGIARLDELDFVVGEGSRSGCGGTFCARPK